MISYGVYQLFNLIILLLFVRVLLSWFPAIDWYREPFRSLKIFTDFFMEPFRRIIPPLGMLDISPIVLFIALELLQWVLCSILQRFGL